MTAIADYGSVRKAGWHIAISSGTWKTFDKASGLPDNVVRALYEDGLGGMWIGTDKGLSHRTQDGLFESFSKDNSGIPNNSVKALIPDSYSGVWVGTADGLGYLYQNEQWDTFDAKNSGLTNMVINTFTPDETGGLWIGTDEGLVHIRFSEKPVLTAKLQSATVRSALASEKRAAIIVQPRGGDDEKQNLTFRQMAAYAYQTLVARGYDNDEIYFLSYRPDADVSGDFVADHYAVDGPVTLTESANGTKARDITVADVRAAFDWAVGKGKPDQPLLFIFVGLGTEDSLKLSPFGDTLKGSELNTMIGNYQQAVSGAKVITMLETPYAAKIFGKIFGQNRILIGSTNTGRANYDAMGMISFNSLLFNSLRSGKIFMMRFRQPLR
ncbi:MAG: hypothetical protein HC887_07185 [Desulfobacteraceae bacterium]|nr:hypothetical protein [Desulfobacteraceae bacterium]